MITRDIDIFTDLICTPRGRNTPMDIMHLDFVDEKVHVYDVRTDREYTLKFSEVNFLIKESD